MTRRLRVHFDGRVLVPEGPVDLPLHQSLEVEIAADQPGNGDRPATPEEIQERLRKFRESAGVFSGPVLPDEALRRENMYEERP